MSTEAVSSLLLWIGAVGTGAFLVVMLVEGWLRPDYSPVRQPVSALSLGARGWIQVTNFAVAGIAVTAAGVGVVLSGTGLVLAIRVMVFGVGLAGSAVPMDPSRGHPHGAPAGDPDQPTWSHRFHDLAGAVVFFSLPVIAVVAVVALPEWWMTLNAAVMVVVLCATLYFWGRSWEAHSPRTGLLQRLFIVPGWLWLVAVFSVLAVG